jgi:cytochrome c peroxidase
VFSDKTDTGRLANLTNPMTDLAAHAAFRTASLREVKDTAPYMRNGKLAGLPKPATLDACASSASTSSVAR